MQDKTAVKLLAVLLAATVVASVAVVGVAQVTSPTPGNQTQSTSYLRIAHASPDAPAVDVMVEGETVLENAAFGNVSEYLGIEAGTYNVTIAASANPEIVVFDDAVTVSPRVSQTVVATGEVTPNRTAFEPAFYTDDAFTPMANESAVRVVHLSPDAPAVDVTAGDGSVVLADNVSFRNSSDYLGVPAGNYTVEIRAETAANNGSIVATVPVSLDEHTAYTAWAVGYLAPDEAPADTPFGVTLTEDATQTVVLPSMEIPDETPTETETPTPTDHTDTPTVTETMDG